MDTIGHVCPSEDSLVLLASTHAGLRQAQAALAVCPRCTRLLGEIERDRGFEADLRELVSRPALVSTFESRGLVRASQVSEQLPTIAGYEVIEEAHRGGQGVVYRAVQQTTKRTAAVKLLLAGQLASLRERYRFEREIEIASSLKHPNIVSIFEGLETSDGRLGYAMEFVEGVSLDAWAAARRTAKPNAAKELRRECLTLMVKVCRAVQYAHGRGVIHRDLKPGNILIDTADEPHVLDFGLARRDDEQAQREREGGSSITMPGEFLGTPQYASPEQMELAPSEVDGRTDVYALGVMLYKLVCGMMPYSVDGSVKQIIESVCKVEPMRPREAVTKTKFAPVDLDLETILLKALAKDRERRYQTALGLAMDVELLLRGEAIEARRDSTWYVIRKRLKARRVEVAAAVVVAMIAIGAAVGGGVLAARASDAKQREALERRLREQQAIRAAAVATVIAEILPPADQSATEPPSRWLEENLLDVREAMDAGWLSEEPELAAQVQSVLSDIYALRGTRSGWYAESSARTAKMLMRDAYGEDDPRVLRMQEAEIAALIARKRGVEAVKQADALLKKWQAMGDEWSERAASTRTLLALAQLQLGQASEAEANARSVIASGYASTNPDTGGRAWNVLAQVLESRGEQEEAAKACISALKARMQRRRDTDADVIASLVMLARLLPEGSGRDGRPSCEEFASLADALRVAEGSRDLRPLMERAQSLVAVKQWLFGTENVEVAESMALLGNSSRRLHAWPEAALWSQRTGEVLQRVQKQPSFAVVNCFSAAAEAHRFLGDANSDAELNLRALDAIRKLPPESIDPLYLAAVLRDAAWVCGRAGRCEEGEPLMSESLEIFKRVMGDQGHVVATTHVRFADIYLHWNKPEQAEMHARRGYELGKDSVSMPADQQMEMMATLIRALLASGRGDEVRLHTKRYDDVSDLILSGSWLVGYTQEERAWNWSSYAWLKALIARNAGDDALADKWAQRSRDEWARGVAWLAAIHNCQPLSEPPWREYPAQVLRDAKMDVAR